MISVLFQIWLLLLWLVDAVTIFFFFFCTSLLLINNTGMLGEGLVKAEQRILHSVTSEMFFAHVVAEGEAF